MTLIPLFLGHSLRHLSISLLIRGHHGGLRAAASSGRHAQAIANNRVASLEVICQQRDANLASEFETAVVAERQKALDAVAVEQSNADRLRNDILGLQEAAVGYQRTIEALHSNNASQQSALREQVEGEYR